MRGGNAVPREEILRERLAAFQLRGGGGGPEDAMAGGAEAIDHARDERAFGTDHGERDGFAFDQRQQAVDVLRIHADVAALGFGRSARVARRDEDFVDALALRQFPRQRVFATAGTDDQDLHALLLHCVACVSGGNGGCR